MGQLVSEDGRHQGWLATLLCGANDDEHPVEKARFRSTTQKVLHKDRRVTTQATVTATPISHGLQVSGGDASGLDPFRPHTNNALSSEQAPSLQPPDLGADFVSRRPQIHTRTSSMGRTRNPSTAGPGSFRRIESSDGLIPLRLAPVVLSESTASTAAVKETTPPTNHTRNVSTSTRELLPDAKRQSYREQRVSPFERCQRRSSAARGIRANLITPESEPVPAMPLSDGDAAQPQEDLRLPSMKSMHQPEVETTGVFATQGERRRLKRKQSLPSVRKSYTEGGDLNTDKEMLELHILIDERRKGIANPFMPGQYVPAVAPPLHLRAQSETLSDTGSDFPRPRTAPQATRDPIMSDAPEKPHRLSATRSISSRKSSRVSGWLSNLIPTNSPPAQDQEPFYKCVLPTRQREEFQASLCTSNSNLLPTNSTSAQIQEPFYRRVSPTRQREESQASLCTSNPELESLTSASSPVSYSHRRSLTADSRMIATSPLSTTYGYDDVYYAKETEMQWPMLTARPSQVGLAL